MPLYLVSCVSQKLAGPAPAKDLYTSSLFRKARSYAEAGGGPWFILSAKHGLLHPEEVIGPYNLTLNHMPAAQRRQWAAVVFSQLEPHLNGIESVVFLAGQRYWEILKSMLEARGVDVRIPMEGLRIGEQLSWLNRNSDG